MEKEKQKANTKCEDCVESATLFKGESVLRILHNQNVYFLRITKTNKLILTK